MNIIELLIFLIHCLCALKLGNYLYERAGLWGAVLGGAGGFAASFITIYSLAYGINRWVGHTQARKGNGKKHPRNIPELSDVSPE
jgi:hypothetical protein